jgi:hypothetical protein
MEPTSFVGIKLAAPLDESAKECPKENVYGAARYMLPLPAGQAECWEKEASSSNFTIAGGHVEELYLEESDVDSDTLLSALVMKYGPPMSMGNVELRNGAGGQFVSHTATWKGPNVTMFFQSIADKVNRCRVTLWSAKRASEMDAMHPKQEDLAKHF